MASTNNRDIFGDPLTSSKRKAVEPDSSSDDDRPLSLLRSKRQKNPVEDKATAAKRRQDATQAAINRICDRAPASAPAPAPAPAPVPASVHVAPAPAPTLHRYQRIFPTGTEFLQPVYSERQKEWNDQLPTATMISDKNICVLHPEAKKLTNPDLKLLSKLLKARAAYEEARDNCSAELRAAMLMPKRPYNVGPIMLNAFLRFRVNEGSPTMVQMSSEDLQCAGRAFYNSTRSSPTPPPTWEAAAWAVSVARASSSEAASSSSTPAATTTTTTTMAPPPAPPPPIVPVGIPTAAANGYGATDYDCECVGTLTSDERNARGFDPSRNPDLVVLSEDDD